MIIISYKSCCENKLYLLLTSHQIMTLVSDTPSPLNQGVQDIFTKLADLVFPSQCECDIHVDAVYARPWGILKTIYLSIYIYIYREREREREFPLFFSCLLMYPSFTNFNFFSLEVPPFHYPQPTTRIIPIALSPNFNSHLTDIHMPLPRQNYPHHDP